MTAERWTRICELFHNCVTHPSLLLEWGTDANDIAEVQKLIAQNRQADEFLEAPPEAVQDLHAEEAPLFTAGDLLAHRYRVQCLIGKGGMGQVYSAIDEELDVRVAVKVMHPDLTGEGFRRELQHGRQVTHPNVCRLFDIARHDGAALLTMELVEGETLASRLRRAGRFTIDEALPIIEQLLEGLAAIHQAGVVHRDFTPANIMLLDGRAVIMDFGLSSRKAVPTDQIRGTLAYMAPEQLLGEPVTERADLYSFGAVLNEMLIRERPKNWVAAIQSALAEDPAKRPASAEGLRSLFATPLSGNRRQRIRPRLTHAAKVHRPFPQLRQRNR